MLEHLDKNNGRELFAKAERWASKKILLSCPNGYVPQKELYGNAYQAHVFGWEIDEITNMGYKAYGMAGLRWKPSKILFFPLLFWALISIVLQGLTYRFPRIACAIFYVKDIEKSTSIRV